MQYQQYIDLAINWGIKIIGALAELADSSVNFNVRPWVKSEDYWNVRSDLLEKIKLTFDEKNINIPYPQMDLHLNKAS